MLIDRLESTAVLKFFVKKLEELRIHLTKQK